MVVAGGVGAVVGVFVSEGRPAAHRPTGPQSLRQALNRELALVADLDAALRRGAGPAAALQAVRADHTAHAGALRSTLAAYPGPAPTPSSTTPSPTPTLARLRAAELAAAHAAAAESAALTGADAALLASISACEATHGELLG